MTVLYWGGCSCRTIFSLLRWDGEGHSRAASLELEGAQLSVLIAPARFSESSTSPSARHVLLFALFLTLAHHLSDSESWMAW